MTIEALLDAVRTLSVAERKRLIGLIVDTFTEDTRLSAMHDILEFEGIAAHLADGEDPQTTVSKLRDEWDKAE